MNRKTECLYFTFVFICECIVSQWKLRSPSCSANVVCLYLCESGSLCFSTEWFRKSTDHCSHTCSLFRSYTNRKQPQGKTGNRVKEQIICQLFRNQNPDQALPYAFEGQWVWISVRVMSSLTTPVCFWYLVSVEEFSELSRSAEGAGGSISLVQAASGPTDPTAHSGQQALRTQPVHHILRKENIHILCQLALINIRAITYYDDISNHIHRRYN